MVDLSGGFGIRESLQNNKLDRLSLVRLSWSDVLDLSPCWYSYALQSKNGTIPFYCALADTKDMSELFCREDAALFYGLPTKS